MPRTFKQLLEAMGEVAKGDPDAWPLFRRFKDRATWIEWDPEDPFDPESDYDLSGYGSDSDKIFVIFLPEGARSPSNEAIVWFRDAEQSGRNNPVKVMFVDSVPCHNDWFGLKAIHEASLIEHEDIGEDVSLQHAAWLRCRQPEAASYMLPVAFHLMRRHDAMMYRLIDRRLRGRIADRVKSLKTEKAKPRDAEALIKRLHNDIRGLVPLVWSGPANTEEHHAREELFRSTARGAIAQHLTPPTVYH